MNFIQSKENGRYKKAKSLLKSKYRNKEKMYLAEGLRTVELAFEYGRKVESVFISSSFYENNDERNKMFIRDVNEKSSLYVLGDDIFKELTTTENSQGVTAIIKMDTKTLDDFNPQKHKKIVILDRVQDPGNMGTIIRTADAAGYDLVITNKGTVDVYNPKVVRASMGSLFYMDIISACDDEIVDILKSNDVEIISSYLKTDKYYDSVKYSEKSALVVGNEANGISDFWIENSDILVKIPMFGKAESLNVAVSAGILIYAIK